MFDDFSLIFEQNVKKIMIQTGFNLFKRQSHKFSFKKLKNYRFSLKQFFFYLHQVFNILIILDTNLFRRLRKLHEHKKQVTQVGHDLKWAIRIKSPTLRPQVPQQPHHTHPNRMK